MNLFIGIILALVIFALVPHLFPNRFANHQYDIPYTESIDSDLPLEMRNYQQETPYMDINLPSTTKYYDDVYPTSQTNNLSYPNYEKQKQHKPKMVLTSDNQLISTPMIICGIEKGKIHLPRKVAEGYQDSNLAPGEIQLPSINGDNINNESEIEQPIAQNNQHIKVNWRNQLKYDTSIHTPSEELQLLIKELGSPKLIDKDKDGSAIWKKNDLQSKGLCWDHVMIRDLPSDFLFIHYYFPIMTLNTNLDLQNKINSLQQLNQGIDYNTSHQMLEANSDTLSKAVSLLAIGKRYLLGQINYPQAQQFLPILLNQTDRFSTNYQPQVYHQLIDELCYAQYNLKNRILPPIVPPYTYHHLMSSSPNQVPQSTSPTYTYPTPNMVPPPTSPTYTQYPYSYPPTSPYVYTRPPSLYGYQQPFISSQSYQYDTNYPNYQTTATQFSNHPSAADITSAFNTSTNL